MRGVEASSPSIAANRWGWFIASPRVQASRPRAPRTSAAARAQLTRYLSHERVPARDARGLLRRRLRDERRRGRAMPLRDRARLEDLSAPERRRAIVCEYQLAARSRSTH